MINQVGNEGIINEKWKYKGLGHVDIKPNMYPFKKNQHIILKVKNHLITQNLWTYINPFDFLPIVYLSWFQKFPTVKSNGQTRPNHRIHVSLSQNVNNQWIERINNQQVTTKCIVRVKTDLSQASKLFTYPL